mgnify:CR=1 FL=1
MIPVIKVEWKSTQFDWQDITSKVMLPLRFFYCKRNLDYSVVLTETNLDCKDSLNPSVSMQTYFRDWNLRIRILVDGVVRYTGYVDDISYLKEKKVWRLNIKSFLHKFTQQDASTNIFSFIGTGTPTQRQYYVDGNGKIYVQMLWLLYKLFQQVSFGLDYTDVEGQIWRPYDGNYYLEDLYYEQIKFDLNMLQCWNQPDTANRVNLLNTEKDYASNKLNAFDMLSYLCSTFGFSITPIGDMNYKLWRLRTVAERNYDTSVNSEIYSYDKKQVEAEFTSAEGYTVIHTLGNETDTGAIVPSQDREYYYDTVNVVNPREVKTVIIGEGKYQVDLMKHFMVIKEHGASTPPLHSLSGSVDPKDVGKLFALPKYQMPTIETFTRKVDFSKPCVMENEFVFDENNYYSKITQETMIVL